MGSLNNNFIGSLNTNFIGSLNNNFIGSLNKNFIGSLNKNFISSSSLQLYFYQIYSFQLETLGVFKIGIFKSTSLKLGSLNRKFLVDYKNGLNLENLITNESVDPYSPFFRNPVDILKTYPYRNRIISQRLKSYGRKIISFLFI